MVYIQLRSNLTIQEMYDIFANSSTMLIDKGKLRESVGHKAIGPNPG